MVSRKDAPVPSTGATLYQCAALSFGIEQGGRGKQRPGERNDFLICIPTLKRWKEGKLHLAFDTEPDSDTDSDLDLDHCSLIHGLNVQHR